MKCAMCVLGMRYILQ